MWITALLPALIASIYYFGIQSLRIITLSIAFSVIFDALSNYFVPGKDPVSNWSSVLMGILLAVLMPLNTTWWMLLIGCFIMIILGKKLFGGLGAFPVNPVLLSYAMLSVSWPARFDYTAAMIHLPWKITMIEPVRLVKTLGTSAQTSFEMQHLLMGKQVAGVANGMVLYLLIGGIFLLLIRQIRWQLPVSFLAGIVVTSWLISFFNPGGFATPVFHLLAGSSMFAAFFLITDYTTSPVNNVPMLIYGFLGGLIFVLIRSFSIYPDGIAFAILLVNLFNPLLDRITPKIYGIKEIKHA